MSLPWDSVNLCSSFAVPLKNETEKMLRNRGVNVTERKIRDDVLRAYEFDIFEAPRWKYMQELGYQANSYRQSSQPRYCTVPKPVYYQTGRSSTNYRPGRYGARRVYLPENEWGASSADDSMMFIRNPRYNIQGSYYPNEVFERPYRRERYPDGYYSRRMSSLYMEDDELDRFYAARYAAPSYCPRRPTPLSRKVTKKLSPIFPCECDTTPNVKETTEEDNYKPKRHHMSKEAKKLTSDICKILSLLRKDGEDEHLSSISILQNIHDLECQDTDSAACRDICTQRVQISSKMPNQKPNPSEKFKAATGVRSKLEALLGALKQYEEEKTSNELDSYDLANRNYNNVVPSDPPSLEVRSYFEGKDIKSYTNIKSEQKDMVLQTEKPKTSNKNVSSKIKTKKDNMIVERKSLRSRLSWKKREATGMNINHYSSNERLSDKLSTAKGFLKIKSKDRIGPETGSPKQGQANKAGLMITIGGNSQRNKQKHPKEKHKDKMPKTWIRKFLETSKDSKNNNMYIRWNNKAFYTKSSSTIIELVNHVYKQLGIKDYAKSDDVSVSNIKKVPKKTIYKSKTRLPKSPNKPKYKQKLKAYMMPQMIVPGPVYMPGNSIKNREKKNETNRALWKTPPTKSKRSLFELPFQNCLNNSSYPSSDYFEIHLPKDFFRPVETKEEQMPASSDEQVYKITEYETIQSDTIERSILSDDGLIFDDKYLFGFNENANYRANKHIYMVEGTQSMRFPAQNVAKRESELKPTKSLFQLHCDTAAFVLPHTSFLKKSCSLIDKIMEHEYLNWMPLSDDSFIFSQNYMYPDFKDFTTNDYTTNENLDTGINNLAVTLDNIGAEIETNNHDYTGIKVKNKIGSGLLKRRSNYTAAEMETNNHDYTEIKVKNKIGSGLFKRRNNYTIVSNIGRWSNKASKTISASLIGIYSKKPVLLSLYWNLFSELLKSTKDQSKTPTQDLTLVQPPKIVSEPKCSCKPLEIIQAQKPLPPKLKIPVEPLRLVRSAHVFSPTEISVESELHSTLHKPLSVLSSYTLPATEKEGMAKKSLSFIIKKAPSLTQSSSILAHQTEQGETAVNPMYCESPGLVKPSNETTEGSEMSKSIKESHSELKNVEKDNISIFRKRRRFVRSDQSIPAKHRIQFVFNPSLPLLQQNLRHFHLLLSIHSLNTLRAGQRLEHNRKNGPEDGELKLNDENRGDKDISQSSQIQNYTSEHVFIMEPINKEEDTVTKIHESYKYDEKEYQTKIQESYKYDEKEYQKTNTRNIKTKKRRNAKFITHIPPFKNNVYTSDKLKYLNKTESLQLSLKIKNGDKITKISIQNHNASKVKNTKTTNQTKYQEHVVDTGSYTIDESANKTASKNVKVIINIMNTEEANNNNPVTDNIPTGNPVISTFYTSQEQQQQEINSNLEHNANVKVISDQHNSVHKFYASPHLMSKSYSKIDDMCRGKKLPVYVMEATRHNSLYGVSLEEFIGNVHMPRTESSANNIVEENNNTTDNTIPTKPTPEVKQMLNAMMVTASDLAAMTVIDQVPRHHNRPYTTLSEQIMRRKEIINMFSDINIKKKVTNKKYQAKFNSEEFFGELDSGDSRSRCNVLTRKLTSHRRVEVDENRSTSFHIKEKRQVAANYNIITIPHSVNPVMQPYKTYEDFIFKDQDDDEYYPQSLKYKKYTSRRKGHRFANEAVCWCCGKNVLRKNRKYDCNTKESFKDRVGERCKEDTVILSNIDHTESRDSSVTEYKIFVKDNLSYTIKNCDSEVNNADILQSHIVKKAVLQIYSETVTNEGYVVAKIPKYLKLPST